MSIKILVVEDEQDKASEIIAVILSEGVNRDSISDARSSMQALKLMESTKFDLLILDMGLPLRLGDEPNINVGLDLLDEISSKEEFYTPKYIICVTGIEDDIKDVEEEFKTRYWQLVRTRNGSDEWKEKVRQSINHAQRDKLQQFEEKYHTDVLVIVALATPELSALLDSEIKWSKIKYLDNTLSYYEGSLVTGSTTINFIACSCPSMGLISTAITTTNMLRKFRPRIAVMTGICAGFKEEVNLGDIIIANPAWNYQTGKIIENEEGVVQKMEMRQHDLEHSISVRLTEYAAEVNKRDDIDNGVKSKNRPTKPPTCQMGAMVSGSSVVASEETMREISRQDRKLKALDMEMAAFYQACRTAIYPAPLYFGVKSVVDLGDSSKGDSIQEYASKVSSKFAINFIKENISTIRQH